MSKKHKKPGSQPTATAGTSGSFHAAEYAVIKHDLWKVVYLNVIYLAALLVVYATNSKTHYLEHWFGKLFRF